MKPKVSQHSCPMSAHWKMLSKKPRTGPIKLRLYRYVCKLIMHSFFLSFIKILLFHTYFAPTNLSNLYFHCCQQFIHVFGVWFTEFRLISLLGCPGELGEQRPSHSSEARSASTGGVPGSCREVMARENRTNLPQEELYILTVRGWYNIFDLQSKHKKLVLYLVCNFKSLVLLMICKVCCIANSYETFCIFNTQLTISKKLCTSMLEGLNI